MIIFKMNPCKKWRLTIFFRLEINRHLLQQISSCLDFTKTLWGQKFGGGVSDLKKDYFFSLSNQGGSNRVWMCHTKNSSYCSLQNLTWHLTKMGPRLDSWWLVLIILQRLGTAQTQLLGINEKLLPPWWSSISR